MKKYFKILIGILIVSNLFAESNQKKFVTPKMTEPFSESYYKAISEKLSAWIPAGEINSKTDVYITISPDGKFDYEFVRESKSKEFNEGLKAFLDEQKNVKYPVYMNQTVKTFITFKKEK